MTGTVDGSCITGLYIRLVRVTVASPNLGVLSETESEDESNAVIDKPEAESQLMYGAVHLATATFVQH